MSEFWHGTGTADKYPAQVAYFGTRENVLNWAGTKQNKKLCRPTGEATAAG